ncbi:MAG: hypothetical protein Q9P01_22470 [Anaerolineae bacterium]|nr:hypothetical protein [Anaerolineae bacterium]
MRVRPAEKKRVKADFPEGLNATVQYGNRLKAQAVCLNRYQLLTIGTDM